MPSTPTSPIGSISDPSTLAELPQFGGGDTVPPSSRAEPSPSHPIGTLSGLDLVRQNRPGRILSPSQAETTTRRVLFRPGFAEHIVLMADRLPPDLNPRMRGLINIFVCYLERQGLSWSRLEAPGRGAASRRPLALEKVVNNAIRKHGLNQGTRDAINLGLKLSLQPEPVTLRTPTSPAHIQLLATVPRRLREQVGTALGYLDENGVSWSQLRPDSTVLRPAELERIINEGIRYDGLAHEVRPALNRAFGMVLQDRPDQNLPNTRSSEAILRTTRLHALAPVEGADDLDAIRGRLGTRTTDVAQKQRAIGYRQPLMQSEAEMRERDWPALRRGAHPLMERAQEDYENDRIIGADFELISKHQEILFRRVPD